MPTSRLRPSPARERWVLAAGICAGAALGGAALTVLPDADAAASAEVARASAEAARLIQDQWRSLQSSREELVPLRRDLPLYQKRLSGENAELRSLERSEESTAFDALFAESARLETRQSDLSGALAALDEALAATTDEERLARGLLRKIQLAAKAEDADLVRETWKHVASEWAPQTILGEVSLTLQCAVAAGDFLDESERALAQSPLAQAFENGSLPLPQNPVIQDFWIEQLEGLSLDPGGRTAITRGRVRREVAALRAERELPSAPAPKTWQIDFDSQTPLAHWFESGGDSLLRFVDLPATQTRLVEEALLPEGFQIAFDGQELSVPQVRERTSLFGTPLRFRVGHEAPERLRRAQVQRVRYGRLGLLALAGTLVLASFFTARMLRRERLLAEMKTRFIAGISHDLRTPLASILLMADNLESGRIQGESALTRYYRSIRGEADRLRRLVDDVLDFSRIERGEGAKLKIEETRLEAFLDELEQELQARVERSNGTLRVERKGLPASFALDRDAVRRALWNLIDNALVHGQVEGDPSKIRLAMNGSSEGLVLEVEDRGPGIAAADRETIFEPFRQGGASTAEHAGGTGLGLAIVREIVRAHGGRIGIHSGPEGRGALFRITLPDTLGEVRE